MGRELKPFPNITSEEEQNMYPEESSHGSAQHGRKRMPRLLLLCIAVIILVVASGIAYWQLASKRHLPTKPHNTGAASQPLAAAPSTTSTTQQYVSNGKDLNLSFSYPADWTVSPPTNRNSTDQSIAVSSPLTNMTDATGTSITGKIVVAIRPGAAEISELASGNATVAQDSVQIAYAKPTAAQHQYPYITFIHVAGGANPTNGFEEVIVTGVTSFAKGQPITPSNLTQLDPIITASFYKCSTKACTGSGASPMSINSATWQNDDIFKQVQNLLESLQLN